MNRTSTINDIISKRQSRQQEISRRLNSISSILNALRGIDDRSKNIQSHLSSDEKVCSALRTVDSLISNVVEKASKLENEMRRLKSRTQRDTLNIGIVGVPKQGKSTFLQALTGLDEATIPTGTDFVTGACSYLRHDPEVAPNDAYAIVTPYTRREFLEEVLNPFCDKFDLHLSSVDDLPYLRLPDKEGMMESLKRMLERLEQLQAEYHTFKDLLGQESRRISKNEIRRYVAQCDENCREKYTYWYAIKKAEIHCRFPQDDIGRIMICDTPGLGDFTPSARRALMEKLSTDMDVVFFLKRLETSDQTISERDTDFHDVVKQANPNLSVTDWAYMILNCPNGSEPSDIFRQNLANKLPTRKGAQTLDAKSKDSVGTTFNAVLEDIVGQIPKIDDKLINSYSEQIEDLQLALRELVAVAKKVKIAQATAGARLNALLMDKLLNNLFVAFEAYKNEIETNGLTSLAPEIARIISDMRSTPPTFEFNELQKAQPSQCAIDGKNHLRSCFIEKFAELDASMEKMVKNVQDRLQDILTSENGGRLGFVKEYAEGGNFWDALRGSLIDSLGDDDARPLVRAIDNVTGIKMNFRAFILPRLTEITHGLSNAPMPKGSRFATFAHNPSDTIDIVLNKLNSAWRVSVGISEELFDEDEGDMKDVNSTPSKAMIALIDEFELLWFYYNGMDNAKTLLTAYYEKHQGEVWPEEFKSDSSTIVIANQWEKAISNFYNTISQLH